MGGGAGERVGTVAGPVHDIPGAVEIAGDDLGDGGIVVHDEHPGAALSVLLLLHGASLAPRTRRRRHPAPDVPVS
ncbi:hypothetical protein GCM10010276_41520 [Streptomyces longisporus]|uniref:Uncharacterized protein n=1 Tax=Streptomyces longisporus TaxID=1948 RepID=A0ABP5ZG95_STRLO